MDLFINKQKSQLNKDLSEGKTLDHYLEMTKDFKSSFPEFYSFEIDGKTVIDESLSCEVGYKARAGEMLIKNLKERGVKEIVYVQPRQGFAGISLSYLCKMYGLSLTLIMPSSKIVSPHQLYCIELGAKPLFLRVAAMPNANEMAKKYAKETGAYYVPLGLYHKDVIACGVRQIYDYYLNRKKPTEVWSVVSTGVLTRTLQIALPEVNKFVGVAVSRNIQDGELGKASFISYHKPFNQESDYLPIEFDCESRYDAKGFDYFSTWAEKGAMFFSVAGNAPLSKLDPKTINSYRDWNDKSDFKF